MSLRKVTLDSVFPYVLGLGGLIGLIASFILSYDTLKIAGNHGYRPSCSINPILSCGDVISAKGDTILGLPYPFYGIAAFAVLVCVAVSLLAGARFKRWFWLAMQGGVAAGLVGSYYLLFKSMYVIHALCPFCLTVDVVVTILFWYVTLYNFDTGHLRPKNARLKRAGLWMRRHHLDLIVLWFLLVIAFILHHFWYYYGKHLF